MDKLLKKVYNEMTSMEYREFVKRTNHLCKGIKDKATMNKLLLMYHHNNINYNPSFYGIRYHPEEIDQLKQYFEDTIDYDLASQYVKIHKQYYNDFTKVRKYENRNKVEVIKDLIPTKFMAKISNIKREMRRGYFNEEITKQLESMSNVEIYQSELFKRCSTQGQFYSSKSFV